MPDLHIEDPTVDHIRTVSLLYASSFSCPSPMPRNAHAGVADNSAAADAKVATTSRLLLHWKSCAGEFVRRQAMPQPSSRLQ